MPKLLSGLPVRISLLRAGALAAAAAGLSGCVAQVGIQAPPRPAYYQAAIEVQARDAPPPLPDYGQPPCPEDGYLRTPGYWA